MSGLDVLIDPPIARIAADDAQFKIPRKQLLQIRAGTFDARNDAKALLLALDDPEALQQGMQYVSSRIKSA